jgi:hypothetical protein
LDFIADAPQSSRESKGWRVATVSRFERRQRRNLYRLRRRPQDTSRAYRTRRPYCVLGSLRWRPPGICDRRLDHFFAQNRSRRGGAIEFERPAALRDMSRIGLHLVDYLLLRLATADELSKRYSAQCKSTHNDKPPRLEF